MFDIIGKRRWFFALSLAVTIPGLLFILGGLINPKVGLQFAIDFTGGTVWTIRFDDPNVTADQVKGVLDQQAIEANVTQTGTGFMEIRTKVAAIAPAPSASPSPVRLPVGLGVNGSVGLAGSVVVARCVRVTRRFAPPLRHRHRRRRRRRPPPRRRRRQAPARPVPRPRPVPAAPPPARAPGSAPAACCRPRASSARSGSRSRRRSGPIAEQQSLSSVGAVVSSDLITQALVLILVGSIGILLWITYRFRDFRMGATALVALLHDVLVVVGIFAILGTFAGLQIDSLFVTAMLTVIGFSVHDTIVVFDRVRENRARHVGEPFDRIVNHSILQTLGRSITTSLTVVITLLTLLLFAGDAIGTFVLALLIGIISGTYSSIFNAAPLLVVWHNRDDRRRAAELAARPSRRPAT